MKGLPVTWLRSRRCVEGQNCVEAARAGGEVAIRDSKAVNTVAVAYPSSDWVDFVDAIRGVRE